MSLRSGEGEGEGEGNGDGDSDGVPLGEGTVMTDLRRWCGGTYTEDGGRSFMFVVARNCLQQINLEMKRDDQFRVFSVKGEEEGRGVSVELVKREKC